MKVILLQDVKSLGKKDEIVDVSDGYARNMILPKKLGVEANAKNLNDLKLRSQQTERAAQEQLEAARQLADELSDKSVEIKIRAGEGGKIFGSVSTKEIAAAAKDQLGLELDKKKMILAEPIKAIGTYAIDIRLHPKVTAQLRVNVTEM
ncbi:MAG: 50S ribosomal protein L9 [Lachnospiraceae bacterium]|nr:50S ribosomal protein L9 [Lachnospiraceae bacterium]